MSDDFLNSLAASYTFQFVFLFMFYMLLSVCISSDSFNKHICKDPDCKVPGCKVPDCGVYLCPGCYGCR